MKKISIFKSLLFLSIIAISCNNFHKVDLGSNCLSNLNLSYFRGAYPDMLYENAIQLLGKPDEEILIDNTDEQANDLVYYNNIGRLILHWSGFDSNPIGMIEFRPKYDLQIYDFHKASFNLKKKRIQFECDDEYKVKVILNDDLRTIKEIQWWFK